MTKGYIIGIIVATIVTLVIMAITAIFGVQSFKNSAIGKEELVESSLSDLNAEYNRRSGLLVNLAEAVLSYSKCAA
jgi:LemA protein